MKMTKRVLAVVMVVALIAALLVGCGKSNNNNNNNENSSSAAESAAGSSAASLADGEEAVTGSGDNSKLALSMTLFDVEYTLGKSKVKDLSDHEWGYDPESWKNVDMDKKIEYKEVPSDSYGKKMDNDTTEISLSYKNLSETFATPANCEITSLDFSGSPDAAIAKAGVKILGGKIDLTTCTDVSKLESALGTALSSYTKKSDDYSSFTSIDYKFELKDGKGSISVQNDKEKNVISKITASLDYNDEAAVSETTSGEAASYVSTGQSKAMWEKDGETLSASGDSSKLTPSISLFDKDYTVGKTTLKQMVEDGWGYDSEKWKDVDMKGNVEYKKGFSNKTLHNNTAEAEIDICNYASVSALPEDCIVSTIKVEGSPDGVFTKAGIKLCDGKIDLSSFTSISDVEDALKSAASWVEKKKVSDTLYNYHFLPENGNGSVVMYVSLDKDNKIRNYDIEVSVNDKYTYSAD